MTETLQQQGKRVRGLTDTRQAEHGVRELPKERDELDKARLAAVSSSAPKRKAIRHLEGVAKHCAAATASDESVSGV